MSALTKKAKNDQSALETVRGAVTNHSIVCTGEFDIESELARVEQWRDATATAISKVASVLGGRTINPIWTNDVPIAATDGQDLYLSAEWFGRSIVPKIMDRDASATVAAWADLRAIAYHELAHILWTPRSNHKPLKGLKDRQDGTLLMRWWNMLEDQRIESLFVVRYAPSRPLFTGLVLRHVLAHHDDHKSQAMSHLLLHGRKFLPKELRRQYRKQFVQLWGEDIAKKLEALIDRYRLLTFPTDGDEAVEILLEFQAIIRDELEPEDARQIRIISDFAQNEHEKHKQGRTESVAEERKTRDEMVVADEKDEAEDFDSGVDLPFALQSDTESDVDAVECESGGTSEEESGYDELVRASQDLLEEIEYDEWSEGLEMLRTVSTLARDSEASSIPRVANTWGRTSHSIQDWMPVAANRLRNELMKLTTDSSESWERGNSSGRLNTLSAMSSRGLHCDVFDAWVDVDEEELSFETVILIDRSGSMSGSRNYKASQALWVVRRAFAQLDIPTTVIGYNHESRMEAVRTDLASAESYEIYNATGGTEPGQGLTWASSIFQTSRAANKLLVSITDGMWGYSANSSVYRTLAKMRGAGVSTLLVTIDQLNGSYIDRHGGLFNGHREIVPLETNTLSRMSTAIGAKVSQMIQERLNQAGVAV